MTLFHPEGKRLAIAFPTDLSEDNSTAFEHALALSLRARGTLNIIHANPGFGAAQRMPDPIPVLTRWGRLKEGAGADTPSELGIEVRNTLFSCCDDTVDTLLVALKEAQPDLLLVPTRNRAGIFRTVKGSVSEALARNAGLPTLFISPERSKLVNPADGSLTMARVLIPMHSREGGELLLKTIMALLDKLEVREVELIVLHITEQPPVALPDRPDRPDWRWRTMRGRGSNVEKALHEAQLELHSDLLVMTSRRYHGMLDFLIGNEAERVKRRAGCPLLSVPFES